MAAAICVAAPLLALVPSCGGGGSSGGSHDGTVSVLLTDAPLVAVNGRTFSEVNVDILAFEASVPRSRSFTSIPFTTAVAPPIRENLLDLNNDQEWLAVAQIPNGRYDAFRITIDTGTAELIDATSGASEKLAVRNPHGELTFVCTPPLDVTDDQNQVLLVVDWDAQRSVSYDATASQYVLAGFFRAFAVNRQAAPLPFRALPARVTANIPSTTTSNTGELQVRVERHSAARYRVFVDANTQLLDLAGNTVAFSAITPGTFAVISGTVDGNVDIHAARVRILSPQNQPPPPGTGTGGTGTGTAPTAHTVFAHGVVDQLDTTGNHFVLRTGFRGPVHVSYSDTGTRMGDARVRPPVPTNDGALQNGEVVDVVGSFTPPPPSGGIPSIDASGGSAGPGGILIVR